MLKAVVLLGLVTALAAGCLSEGNVFDLAEGDCYNYNEDESEDVADVDLVPCDEPHQYEVYAVLSFEEAPGVPFPGRTLVSDAASNLCLEEFDQFVGLSYYDSLLDISTFYPSRDSWENGDDREVICSLYDLEEFYVEGSMRGSRR